MSSAKAALESDTRVLAFEAGRKYGVRVNAISAGPLASRAASAIGIIEKMVEYCAVNSPLTEPLQAEEVGHAAAFLSSPLADGITGTVLYVDKGYHSQIKIWGSDGWLELRKHGAPVPLEWYSNKEGKVRRYEGPLDPNGYEPFVKHVVRAAAGLEPPVLTAEDSRYVLHVVFAAYRAAETGQTQKVGL